MDSVTKINKAIGCVIGGLVGLIAVRWPWVSDLATPAVVDQVAVLLGGAVGTYLAPANSSGNEG